MFFNNDRSSLRQSYADAWHKYTQQQILSPLELQIASVIKEHPEYHQLITQINADYTPEQGQSNPFLHMGMHLALREQISTNRPAGIQSCFNQLSQKLCSPLEAEHRMMECLGHALWEAQQQSCAPDEAQYLACLKKITSLG